MKVAVIGAGPAGLSAAIELKQRGIEPLVLEREAEIGGKCHTLFHRGRAYDLGANLTTPRYTMIRSLALDLGLTLRDMAPRQVRHVSAPDQPIQSPLADSGALSRLFVRGGAAIYNGLRDLADIDRDGFAGLPAGVRAPFGVWLDRHGLAPFRDLFANLFVAYGYGVMDELPAAYAMKFFDRIHLDAAVDVVLGEPVATTKDFKEGFQELWERVDRHYAIGTVRGAHVKKIRRSPRGVQIGFERDGVLEEARVDGLVIASPLDRALEFLDASSEEERLFPQFEFYTYYVTAIRASGLPRASTYVQPYCQQVAPGLPTVFYGPGNDDPDDDVYLFYAYGGTGVDEASVRTEIERVVGAFGGHVLAWLTTQSWRYFPHVQSPVMQAGFYDDLDAIQGQWHTTYVGEALSFTLVELSARHAKHLVGRHYATP